MIKNFLHSGLEQLVLHNQKLGIKPSVVAGLMRHLSRLSVSKRASDMHLPGWNLETLPSSPDRFFTQPHPNYRLEFSFRMGHAVDVDLTDLNAK